MADGRSFAHDSAQHRPAAQKKVRSTVQNIISSYTVRTYCNTAAVVQQQYLYTTVLYYSIYSSTVRTASFTVYTQYSILC